MKNITTLFLTVLFSFSMLANVAPADKEALVKLYKATNGSQWITKWDLSPKKNAEMKLINVLWNQKLSRDSTSRVK